MRCGSCCPASWRCPSGTLGTGWRKSPRCLKDRRAVARLVRSRRARHAAPPVGPGVPRVALAGGDAGGDTRRGGIPRACQARRIRNKVLVARAWAGLAGSPVPGVARKALTVRGELACGGKGRGVRRARRARSRA
eukprot:762433-Hanusia_phi.AAC.17